MQFCQLILGIVKMLGLADYQQRLDDQNALNEYLSEQNNDG